MMRSLLFILTFTGASLAATCGPGTAFEGDFLPREIDGILEAGGDEALLDEACRNVQKRFENSGFPGAVVERSCRGDTLVFTLNRGEGYVFAAARNAGQGKTRDDVFAKLSGLEPGSPVILEDLDRASAKLERTGYFVQIKPPELYREVGRNRLVPLFHMQEATNSYAEGVVSYSSEDNAWVGTVDVSLKNIAGTARDLELNGVTGDEARSVSFSYREPWLFGSSWNGLVRAYVEDDTSYTDALLELGLERPIAFEWTLSLLGGIGNDEWTMALEVEYENQDSYVLPRKGSRFEGAVTLERKRESHADWFLTLEGKYERWTPLIGNFILRSAASGGTMLPTFADFDAEDYFKLGGANSWKGFRPSFLRTRAYGDAELALRFQGLPKTAFEAFYQPGLYRELPPNHGWTAEHQYGLGIIQYRSSFAISLYYALRPSLSMEEGFLHFSVKALF